MKTTQILAIFLMTILGFQAKAGLMMNYSELMLKNLDQMSKLVRAKVQESKKAKGNKVIPLKEGLQMVLARPNEDAMIEKVIGPLKSALEENDAWEKAIQDLVGEAIGALKNTKPFQPVVLVTYQIFLENLISEFKPKALEPFEGQVLGQIRDAKITLDPRAENERRLRVMKSSQSPSEIAGRALQDAIKEKEERDRQAAMEAAVLSTTTTLK